MFKGKKTYIVSALGILSALAGYFTGDLSVSQAAQMAFSAFLASTLRNAIK